MDGHDDATTVLTPDCGPVREPTCALGVNLEGIRYDDWPVARLIEREDSRPLLLTRYRGRFARPDEGSVQWNA